jgi:hypothetical protein
MTSGPMKAVRAFLALLGLLALLGILASVPTTGPVSAQYKPGRGPVAPGDHPPEKKEKADEKGYSSSLKRLPDQKFDPWGNMRK